MTIETKRTLAFGVALLLLIAGLTAVSRSTRPPALPRDAAHEGLAGNSECARCHGPAAAALKPTHPPKDDCVHCHRRAAG